MYLKVRMEGYLPQLGAKVNMSVNVEWLITFI